MKALALVLLLTPLGCSSQPPTTDSDTAKSVLERCLNAWKSGASADSLQKEQPPVFVVEDLWTSQAELLDFSIAPPMDVSGASVRLDVELVFSRKKEKARYVVTTNPAFTVARLETQ